MPRPLTGKPRGRPKGVSKKTPPEKKPIEETVRPVEVNDLNLDKDVQIRRLKEENKSLIGTIAFWKGKAANGKTKEETTGNEDAGKNAGIGSSQPDTGATGNAGTTNERRGIFDCFYSK